MDVSDVNLQHLIYLLSNVRGHVCMYVYIHICMNVSADVSMNVPHTNPRFWMYDISRLQRACPCVCICVIPRYLYGLVYGFVYECVVCQFTSLDVCICDTTYVYVTS